MNRSHGCFSIAQTHQFVAHAFHNATEITSQVGNFSWSASNPTVAPLDANGLATARVPGITGVIASIGATTSPAVFFKTCMPVVLVLHINGDPAGVPTESAIMNATDTKTVQADMVDELGAVTPNAPVTILSNNSTVASVAGTTLTAQSPGGAGSAGRVCAADLWFWNQYADLQQSIQRYCKRDQPQHHHGVRRQFIPAAFRHFQHPGPD